MERINEKNSSHLCTYIQSTFLRDIKVDKDDDLDLQTEEKGSEKKKILGRVSFYSTINTIDEQVRERER